MKQKVRIYFENAVPTKSVGYGLKMLIRRAVLATLDYEEYRNDCALSVTFTDNEGIRELNNRFRGIDRPTDVLSFPLLAFEGSEEPPTDERETQLGDIVLSLERAAEQAEEYGHSYEREIAFLCVHSMLHLLGYDHETGEEDELDMRRRQTEIMDRIGLSVNKDD